MKAKRLSYLINLLVALLLSLGVAQAQEEKSQQVATASVGALEAVPSLRGMDEIVSLDFKSTDVVDALKYLALKGGLNLSTSKQVSGRVNLSLTDVPIRDVFELILRSNGLAFVKQGNVYHIMTEEEYRALYGRRFSDMRQIKTFRLQYASPEAAFNMLDALKSDIGRLLVDRGELPLEKASMAGIQAWARANPDKLTELLNHNASYVFFRELPADLPGPLGALGVPLTPRRSVAVDPRFVPLGAPVYIATTWPLSSRPLNRLMLAQDTGGAIRGVVRADFFWGFGDEAAREAGRMKQPLRMWVLLPNAPPVTAYPD